jgi:hypothetical protein
MDPALQSTLTDRLDWLVDWRIRPVAVLAAVGSTAGTPSTCAARVGLTSGSYRIHCATCAAAPSSTPAGMTTIALFVWPAGPISSAPGLGAAIPETRVPSIRSAR